MGWASGSELAANLWEIEDAYQQTLMRDDIVHACMMLHRRGDLTEIEALKFAVVKLEESRKRLVDDLVKMRMCEPFSVKVER